MLKNVIIDICLWIIITSPSYSSTWQVRQSTYLLLKKPPYATPGLQLRQAHHERNPRFFSVPSVWQFLEINFCAWFLGSERLHLPPYSLHLLYFIILPCHSATHILEFLPSLSQPLFCSFSIKPEMPVGSFTIFLLSDRAFCTLHWTLNYSWERRSILKRSLWFPCSFLQLLEQKSIGRFLYLLETFRNISLLDVLQF